jgi:hypothetical protein
VHATCDDQGFVRIGGQIPDVVFISGIPSKVRIVPWWASFMGQGWSCGVMARSTAAGVSIQDTYGCFGNCPIRPPGEWAAVKSSYITDPKHVTRAGGGIPLVFDGSAARGTQGTIEIGIVDNDLGIFGGNHVAIIATVNVYIESTNPPATWLTVTSSAANVVGDRLILDHPYLNARPSVPLFVSHVRNPVSLAVAREWNHPIAVQYNSARAAWTIRNLDGAAMPQGLGFNVRIDPSAMRVCTPVRPPFQTYEYAVVDHPVSNDNVWATVMVTPIGGAHSLEVPIGGGPHPLAVRFVSPHWQIVYTDGAQMASGTCFNVKVFGLTQYVDDPAVGDLSNRNAAVNVGVGIDVGGDGQEHQDGSGRLLQFPWAFGNPALPIIVTTNLTPLGFRQVLDPRYVGLHYDRTRIPNGWSIYQEDGGDMRHGVRFNVWAAPQQPPQ